MNHLTNTEKLYSLVSSEIESADYFFNLMDAQFYYEWGDEPTDHFSIGMYDKNGEYRSLGYAVKSDVKKRNLPFNNPHS